MKHPGGATKDAVRDSMAAPAGQDVPGGSRRRRRWHSLAVVVLLVPALLIVPHGLSAASSPRTALPLNGRWVPSTLTLTVSALLADPHQPGLLLAGTSDGVWRSIDAGATWRRDGGSPGDDVYALAAPTQKGPILAGTSAGIVYARTGSERGL